MNKKFSRIVFVCVSWVLPLTAQVRPGLEQQLNEIIKNKKAQVGIAVILNGKDTLTVNNDVRYPMMSVFKFHQALVVAHYLQQHRLPLASPIHVRKTDLRTDTYSPLRDKYPQGDIDLSVQDLLTYTLQLSDNNACDILFDRLVGVTETDRRIRAWGIDSFCIAATEEDMHRDLQRCRQNWTSPLGAAELVELFLSGAILEEPYHSFVKRTMIACETGKDRLPKPLLHTKAVVGHKTGTGDRNEKGQLIGTNDIGFVFLPDGQRYSIAVLVKDSEEDDSTTAQLIATISEAVYQYTTQK